MRGMAWHHTASASIHPSVCCPSAIQSTSQPTAVMSDAIDDDGGDDDAVILL